MEVQVWGCDGYSARGAGVRCEGYGGTVRNGTRGTVVRCEGYGGTVRGALALYGT